MPLPLLGAIGGALVRQAGFAAARAIPAHTIFGKALIQTGLKAAPTIAAVAAGMAMGSSGQQKSAPAMPSMPALTPVGQTAGGAGVMMPYQSASPAGGILPFWRGPGGNLQLPWSDPQQLFKPPYALDDSYLRVYYRAPRGYVMVRDQQGRPYAMMKQIARQIGLWKPAPKPPISVGDWHAYKAAKRIDKKLRKIAGPAIRKHSPRALSCGKKKGR